jgi:hypothetical protein
MVASTEVDIQVLLREYPSFLWSFIILILLNTELLKGKIKFVPVRTSDPT